MYESGGVVKCLRRQRTLNSEATFHTVTEGEEVCYGVITVNDTDTTETLQQQVEWRKGNIVEIRKFGTSNKTRVTFAGKEKPRFVHYENMLIPVGKY